MRPEVTQSDLAGAWRLVSWLIHYGGERGPAAPFGRKPEGLLLYGPDGWMSATVHRAGRDLLPANRSPRDLPDESLAGAFRSYFHYAGPWRVEGGRVIHVVEHSLNPNMAGTRQVRDIDLREPLLTLSADEEVGDGTRRHELVWRRASN